MLHIIIIYTYIESLINPAYNGCRNLVFNPTPSLGFCQGRTENALRKGDWETNAGGGGEYGEKIALFG